jgi:phosphate transport system permease protein
MNREGDINRPRWLTSAGRLLDHGDRPWRGLLVASAVLVVALLVGLALLLWTSSSDARQTFGWSFLKPTLDASWNPVSGEFDAWPFIYGTLITSFVALVLAVPMSLGIAVFLSELAPDWLRIPLGWMVELLAAIPSVIYGLWGIFVFLPVVVAPVGDFLARVFGGLPLLGAFFAGPVPQSGASRLAAALILAIMVLPTIAAVCRDVFRAIPNSQREAALALGATQWEMIFQVLIPYGMSGVLGAVILGLGRALGETMAVTMVIGNSLGGSASLLRPGYSMSSVIANEFAEAVTKLHTQALIEVGLILFVITLILNAFARLLVWRVAKPVAQGQRS